MFTRLSQNVGEQCHSLREKPLLLMARCSPLSVIFDVFFDAAPLIFNEVVLEVLPKFFDFLVEGFKFLFISGDHFLQKWI